MNKLIVYSTLCFVTYSMYYHSHIWYILYCILCTCVKILAYILAGLLSAGIAIYFYEPPWKGSGRIKLKPVEKLFQKTQEKLMEYKHIPKRNVKHKGLISRNVDGVIDELIGLLIRDYVDSWFSTLVKEKSLFTSNLKTIIRQMLFTLRDRCQKIDDINFFTSDIVDIIHKHLQNVKTATMSPDLVFPYKVYSFLEKKETELDYLRKISEFFLITLLPDSYARCKPLRSLLREILTCNVLYNLMEKLCDPDWINLKLISWLESQKVAARKHNRLYAAAETYEDFVKIVEECNSIEGLQRWRYYVVTETMSATIMRDLKCSMGVDAEKEWPTQLRDKGALLQARNLPQYLNQLQFTKRLCEKRLKLLGGPDYLSSSKGSLGHSLDDIIPISCKKVLSMNVIMQSSYCRRYFSKYLQKEEMHSLLGFWEAAEEMKSADKSVLHQLANEIVEMYMHDQTRAVRLSKSTLKGIEEFIMANKGPEAFSQAQDEIYKRLDENFYASFIVSDIYHKMIADAIKQGLDLTHNSEDNSDNDAEAGLQNPLLEVEDSDISLCDYSSYARTQLRLTQEKLNDKLRALQAMKNNPKCEKKVTAMLDKEIQDLCSEQNLWQNHIEKTELWIKYLGLWQSTVVQAEVTRENDKPVPYFNIMVHLSNEASHPESTSVGWVVPRSLATFHSLHQKLIPAAVWLKKIDLPTRPRFKSLDKTSLEKMKSSLQTFLSAVTKDDGLNKSEALYTFLSPSPEHMKHPPGPQKKSKFNFFQFFKVGQINFGAIDEGPEEELLFLDENESKEDDKDSIAERLYVLMGEVFELKGVFHWLRKSLIIFVQQAYGKTINRQLRETVSYIVSEPMLLSYLQMFRDTMWPSSPTTAPPQTTRTSLDMLQTKCLAQQMLLSNVPEILGKIVGQQTAKKGVAKVFCALQKKILNKYLFYNILEAFIYKYAPELQKMSSKES